MLDILLYSDVTKHKASFPEDLVSWAVITMTCSVSSDVHPLILDLFKYPLIFPHPEYHASLCVVLTVLSCKLVCM